MSKEAQELLAQAISLPEEERAALVVQLLDSLRADPEAETAQTAESLSRLAAIKAGELEAISNDEAFRIIGE
jgi:putative addiction module component (TIGR02574 family)